MKKAVYFILAILLINFTSCRKTSNSGPTPTNAVSNSTYINAYLGFARFRNIDRDGIGNNVIDNSFNIQAGFGDSINVNIYGINSFGEKVGSVSLGSFIVDSFDYTHIQGRSYYEHAEDHINAATINKFAPEVWKVTSVNGVTDMTFDAGPALSYVDTMPYQITKSAGLTVAINPSTVQGADSVRIIIHSGSTGIAKTVVSTIGTMSFSPSELSGLSAANNWSAFVIIEPYKQFIYRVNGRGYKIYHSLDVKFNINVN